MIETSFMLKEYGSARHYLKRVISFSESNKIVDLEKFKLIKNKYIPQKILKLMYRHGKS
jgi:hypothetical protein